jgi:hypothetical protein
LQGFPDQALSCARANIDDAVAINHTLSLCNALANSACPVALLVGDLAAADGSCAARQAWDDCGSNKGESARRTNSFQQSKVASAKATKPTILGPRTVCWVN